MVKKYQVYKCEVCGNVVSVLTVGGGQLVCCNQPMAVMDEKSGDQGLEKHVPFIQKSGDTLSIRVGETEHPMTDEHYIMWIDTIGDDIESRKYLKPGETPQKEFSADSGINKARAYCNIHGLWKQEEI